MKGVIKCRLSSGVDIDVHPFMMSKIDFNGATVLSGDKYYTDKAVKLGAKRQPKKQPKK